MAARDGAGMSDDIREGGDKNGKGADKSSGKLGRKKPRAPRKVTQQYIENSAAYYLGRFASSKAHLRDLMMKKVHRSHYHHGTEIEEGAKMVDVMIAKFEGLGYLDDAAYAVMRARSFFAKGTPLRGIRFKLARQGLSEDDIEAALSALEAEVEVENLDLAAAFKLARKRRLGPFREPDSEVRAERREKDLATLARAGFSYDVAQQVIDAPSVEELELVVAPTGAMFI
tara:strand:+ start:87534 stop:88217 length:684 start_codon:yes stop_codon:yes gene_type:complete